MKTELTAQQIVAMMPNLDKKQLLEVIQAYGHLQFIAGASNRCNIHVREADGTEKRIRNYPEITVI